MSFQLTDHERRTLEQRAIREHRTVSNCVGIHLRNLLLPDSSTAVRIA